MHSRRGLPLARGTRIWHVWSIKRCELTSSEQQLLSYCYVQGRLGCAKVQPTWRVGPPSVSRY